MFKSVVSDLINILATLDVDPEIIEYSKILDDKSLQEVIEYSSNAKSNFDKAYYCALLLYKVEQASDCPWPKKHEALLKSLNILELKSEEQKLFLQCFDTVLCKIIFKSSTLKETVSMAQFIIIIKNSLEVCASESLIFTFSCQHFLGEFNNYALDPMLENYKKLLKCLQKGIEYGIELKCYLIMVVPEVMRLLDEFVNDNYLLRITEKEARLVWKVIEIIEKKEMEANYNNEAIEKMRKLLGSYGRHRVELLAMKSKDTLAVSGSCKPEVKYNISSLDLEPVGICLNTKDNESLISNVFKGKWNGRNVCLKIYQEKIPGVSFSNVENEIQIYQKLAPLRTKEGCFLDYYGTCIERFEGKKKVTLVMQWVEKSLKNYIEDMKTSKASHDEDKLEHMFIKLLYSFSLLHEQNCYHLDIKPPNILIEGKSYYIIDFDVSISDTGPRTYQSKIVFGESVPYTMGYADPIIQKIVETNMDLGYERPKADVFSLGMTFYHILVGEKFSTDLNKDESKLKAGIQNLPYLWARNLLEKMLDFDTKKRITMNEATILLRNEAKIDPFTGGPYYSQTSIFVPMKN